VLWLESICRGSQLSARVYHSLVYGGVGVGEAVMHFCPVWQLWWIRAESHSAKSRTASVLIHEGALDFVI